MSRNRTLSVHTQHELLLKFEQAGLTEEDAQLVIGSRGNKLAKSLVQFARNGGLPLPANGGSASTGLPVPASAVAPKNPFEKERTEQRWFYPKGFAVPNVSIQIERVQRLWPGIDVSHVATLAEHFNNLPAGFDGIEVKPKVSYFGRAWEMADPYGAHYGPTVERVLAMLHAERNWKFINHRAGQMTDEYIRIQAEALSLMKVIEETTPGDVLVMPVSLGNLYAGYSARNGRWDALAKSYMPNGSAHVGCSLLVMPERLTAYEQLFMDCCADEWNWDVDGRWTYCPIFRFSDGHLQFIATWADDAHGRYGGVVSCPRAGLRFVTCPFVPPSGGH